MSWISSFSTQILNNVSPPVCFHRGAFPHLFHIIIYCVKKAQHARYIFICQNDGKPLIMNYVSLFLKFIKWRKKDECSPINASIVSIVLHLNPFSPKVLTILMLVTSLNRKALSWSSWNYCICGIILSLWHYMLRYESEQQQWCDQCISIHKRIRLH